MMHKQTSMTKNSVFYLVYNVLNVIFPFITGIYVARILPTADIGLVETARNLTQYFVVFSFLGIPTYGLREIAKARNDKEELNKLYTELISINSISTLIFLLLYILLIFIVPAYRENITVFLITGIAIALNFINNTWLFEGLEKFDYISIRNFIFKCVSLALLLVFVRSSNDYLIYAFITVIGTAGNYILNVINSRNYVKLTFSNLNLKRHMKSILFLVVVNLAIEIYSMVDITMLGLMCTKEVVTFYSYGIKIQKILLQVINTFTVVLVPRISLYYKEGNIFEFNNLITKTLKIILIISIPIIIGIYFVGDPVISAIYGEAYIRSSAVLKLLSFTLLVSPIGYLLGSRIMLVTGQENKMLIAVGAGAAVNLIGNSFLIPVFQEIGASIASVVGEIVVAVVYITLSHKSFEIDKTDLLKTIGKIFAALTVMIFILKLIENIEFKALIVAMIQIPCAVIVYFGILILTKEDVVFGYLNKLVLCIKRCQAVRPTKGK